MTRSPALLSITPVRLAVVLLAGSLAGCSTIGGWFSSDKVDYRSQAKQIEGLQVPPDLSQLDNKSMTQDGTISASSYEQQQQQRRAIGDTAAPGAKPAPATAGAPGRLAVNAIGNLSIMRDGDIRWIHTDATPEQLWTQVVAFWTGAGFEIDSAKPELGLVQTKWHDEPIKPHSDIIRDTLGKYFDFAYSSGVKTQYRTRVERAANGGTDIFVSEYSLEEVYTNQSRDNTTWQPAPKDPLLEATMLSRLLLQLGGKAEDAAAAEAPLAAASAAAPAAPSSLLSAGGSQQPRKPRALSEVPDQLVVADGFERAWRRVGQALDRHGFTIEDRDRTQGLFYLRYADPNQVGKEEPNFFQRLFGAKEIQANRYRVAVRTNGDKTTVLILDNNGKQTTDENAKRIIDLLMDDLR